MTIENKFDTPKANEMRQKLHDIGLKRESLTYELFLLQKESKQIADQYSEYLGLKEVIENEKA